jgi:hypothetical protein
VKNTNILTKKKEIKRKKEKIILQYWVWVFELDAKFYPKDECSP